MKLQKILSYATLWPILKESIHAQTSLTRKITAIALTILTAPLFPLIITVKFFYAQQALAKQKKDLKEACVNLNISNPTFIEQEESPLCRFREIAFVSPYKLIGNCGEYINSECVGLKGHPEEVKMLETSHLAFIRQRELEGKKIINELTVYDLEGMAELWQLNKEKIFENIKKMERASFYLSNEKKEVFEKIKKLSRVLVMSEKKCAETMASFIGGNFNLISDERPMYNEICQFFTDLGQIAYGDIHLNQAKGVFIPKKIREFIEFRKEFPQHSLNTIRSLLIHFESSPGQKKSVKALLKHLPPLPGNCYLVIDNKLRHTRERVW